MLANMRMGSITSGPAALMPSSSKLPAVLRQTPAADSFRRLASSMQTSSSPDMLSETKAPSSETLAALQKPQLPIRLPAPIHGGPTVKEVMTSKRNESSTSSSGGYRSNENVEVADILPIMRKDCVLFYCPETEALASKVAAQGEGSITLGRVSWK